MANCGFGGAASAPGAGVEVPVPGADDLEDVEHVGADPWTSSPQADPWNQQPSESNNVSQPGSGMTAPAATPSCAPGMSLHRNNHSLQNT